MSLSLLVGTTEVTFVFSIVLYDWNLNFIRINASLECMIFFIRISRNYVVKTRHSVFLFLVLSVCLAAIFNCDKSWAFHNHLCE